MTEDRHAIHTTEPTHLSSDTVFDTTRAVLLDDVQAAMGHNPDGKAFLGIVLAGRVNRTDDRARLLFILDAEGAARLIAEVEALARRAGLGKQLRQLRELRVEQLRREGSW